MSKTIWKYPLSVSAIQEVFMPKGADILCVQVQKSTPCLWVVADQQEVLEGRIVFICETGHNFPKEPTRYIGTFQVQSGDFVFHVFEQLPELS